MKKILLFICAAIFSFALIGCDTTGSLTQKEKDELIKFLVKNDIIDEKATLDTDGVGEGELFDYYCETKSDGEKCLIEISQFMRKDDYRVFGVRLYKAKPADFEGNAVTEASESLDSTAESSAQDKYEDEPFGKYEVRVYREDCKIKFN